MVKCVPIWSEKPFSQGQPGEQCIYDLCFNPDGSQLLVACGSKVYVYDPKDGSLLQTLKGHKETVYCVAYAADGQRFVSGGADKTVIIWTNKLEGILKYTHNDAIQCAAYNPVTQVVASCAVSDFGLWSAEQKSVTKHKVSSRIFACSWSEDGQLLALGMQSGTISIRSKAGEEKLKIERGSSAAIYSLSWRTGANVSGEGNEILAVADWSQKMAFYAPNGKLLGKEKTLGHDPLFLNWCSSMGNDLLITGGADQQVSLYSKEGGKLQQLASADSWIWAAKMCVNPLSNQHGFSGRGSYLALGTQDGSLSVFEVQPNTVHGLYKDRYAFREQLTDVVICHLQSEQRARIKCKDLVRKVALYERRLAITLSDRVVIYELPPDSDELDMNYKLKEKISKTLECSMLCVCSSHLVLCNDCTLQLFTMRGVKEREWQLEAQIRYIKVVGGPPERETLLVGLKNGAVLKIFINNAFPIALLRLTNPVLCLDINRSFERLAVVDERNVVSVYDLNSNELLFQEPNANSVAWNHHFDGMLAYTNDTSICIKTGTFPTYVHKTSEPMMVVGFAGAKLYCMTAQFQTQTVEIPQFAAVYQYLDKREYAEAYRAACLGVTRNEWETLAHEALEALQFDIAKKAFCRLKDFRYLELLAQIDERRQRAAAQGGLTEKDRQALETVFRGDILAVKGQFADAARLYKAGNQEMRALQMYTDLRMFDLAQAHVGSGDSAEKRQILAKQADWAKVTNQLKQAAEMYAQANEYIKAIEIVGQNGWVDELLNISKRIDKGDRESMLKCAEWLTKLQQYPYAAECYSKLGDQQRVIQLYVEARLWEQAFGMLREHSEFKLDVLKPYARWLCEVDQFEAAQQAFHKAGMREQALRLLEQMTSNAINENRFDDAGYLSWRVSIQFLELANQSTDRRREMLSKFHDYQKSAEMYYVYQHLYRFCTEPFSTNSTETLFNMARYLWHVILEIPNQQPPRGILKATILYTLALQGEKMKAYKIARYAFERLAQHHVPNNFRLRDTLDTGALSIRAKPFEDSQEILPRCYRCNTTNPLLNPKGNMCVNCNQPFVKSFAYFDDLPLVEFFLEADVTDEEALRLIELNETEDDKSKQKKNVRASTNKPLQSFKTESSLHIGGDEENIDRMLEEVNRPGDVNTSPSKKMQMKAQQLRAIDKSEVVVMKWSPPLRHRYFRRYHPDVVSITRCMSCNHVFNTEDFESQVLDNGCCPFCRFRYNEDIPDRNHANAAMNEQQLHLLNSLS